MLTSSAALLGIAVGILLYVAVVLAASVQLAEQCGPADSWSAARCHQALTQ